MIKINKDNYKNVIEMNDRLDIKTELKQYYDCKDSEGNAEAALFIFNKYYDIVGIPKDFYLEAMYWISTGISYVSIEKKEIKS